MTTSTTHSTLLSTGLGGLEWTRNMAVNAIESVPADQRLFQPVEDAQNTLWIMGHYAWTDDAFLTMLSGTETGIPEAWTKMFGKDSEVCAKGEGYPSFDELRAAMDERRAAMIAWLESMDDDALLKPLPEELAGFAPHYAGLMCTMAAHEGMHIGQMLMIRKALKLVPLFSAPS